MGLETSDAIEQSFFLDPPTCQNRGPLTPIKTGVKFTGALSASYKASVLLPQCLADGRTETKAQQPSLAEKNGMMLAFHWRSVLDALKKRIDEKKELF